MENHSDILSTETSLTLLLCSNLIKDQVDAKPLSPSEFGWILNHLESSGKVLTDLAGEDSGDLLESLQFKNISPDRIRKLLDRGGNIAVALESLTNSGIWVLSRLDEDYPQRLLERLKHLAPPLLYGAGDPGLLSGSGVAIVGSRDVDQAGLEFTKKVGAMCASEGLTVISGGARGVDQISMQSASEYGGVVIGILASDLARSSTKRENRHGIMDGRLLLASPYNPNAGFNIGNAMGRNKYIYAMSEWAVVVSSDADKGGTWAGATENLRSDSGVPMFVRSDDDVPDGNRELINKGGIPLKTTDLESGESIEAIFERLHAEYGKPELKIRKPGKSEQLSMFDQ